MWCHLWEFGLNWRPRFCCQVKNMQCDDHSCQCNRTLAIAKMMEVKPYCNPLSPVFMIVNLSFVIFPIIDLQSEIIIYDFANSTCALVYLLRWLSHVEVEALKHMWIDQLKMRKLWFNYSYYDISTMRVSAAQCWVHRIFTVEMACIYPHLKNSQLPT